MRPTLLVLGWMWGPAALAQDYQAPNTVLQVSGGFPWVVSGRAEGWLGRAASGELGFGVGGDGSLGGDWALTWRPQALCVGCGHRDALLGGLGLGGLVVLPLEGTPWGLSAGGDLDLTFVHWLNPTTGLALSARGGAGPAWDDLDVLDYRLGWWAMGGLGVAF